jgi:hypothetical protein
MSVARKFALYRACDFDAALQTLRQVVRLRPSYAPPYEYVAASLAYLGQLDEAREALERVPPQSAEQLQRWQRPPWMRPEDYALRVEVSTLQPESGVECDVSLQADDANALRLGLWVIPSNPRQAPPPAHYGP